MKGIAPSSGHLAYRPDIDGLRALAVISVVFFHAFPAWLPGGFVGVDIFFVISGYLISGVLLSDLSADRFNIFFFYARRVRRIFPALLLVLCSVMCAGYIVLWPGEYLQLAGRAAAGAAFVVNLMLQRETGYFADASTADPLLHLWSLGVEEQFYIVWPVLLWASWKTKSRIGLTHAVVALLSFATSLWLSSQNIIADFYSPASRLWELLAGGALAYLARYDGFNSAVNPHRDTFAFLGLGLIAVANLGLNKLMAFPGWLAAIPVAGSCFIILAGREAFLNRRFLAHPWAVAIGVISYPLYLWHWPLLSFADILAGEALTRFVRIGVVIIAFVLAWLTYRLVERPLRTGPLDKRKIWLLVTAMAIVGTLSAAIFCDNGIPSRFSNVGSALTTLDSANLIKTWTSDVRFNRCHLQEAQDDRHAPDCVEAQRPLLLLWGDSHAASLYPGLKTLQSDYPFGIAQLTQAGCPPLFNLEKLLFRRNCNQINQQILQDAVTLKPAVIILDAAWNHKDYPLSDSELLQRVVASVDTIRQALPKTKIIVVGPAPRWVSPLPSIYRRSLTFSRKLPPTTMLKYLDPRVTALDTKMEERMRENQTTYVSIQKYLCTTDGCKTRLNDEVSSITFLDDEHLTTAAATFVAHALSPTLLEALSSGGAN